MGKANLIRAVEAAQNGDWHAAHNIAQDYNNDTAYWLHAVLHKIEGNETNSRYWYAKTLNKRYEDYSDGSMELTAMMQSLNQ